MCGGGYKREGKRGEEEKESRRQRNRGRRGRRWGEASNVRKREGGEDETGDREGDVIFQLLDYILETTNARGSLEAYSLGENRITEWL